jgi:2-polyprenyl-3-methyl-5-hydroxy-6-metoxy-1,4-benzoquinol methylase
MKTSAGATEDGVVIGNVYDKYGSTNPIVKWMMGRFGATLSDFVAIAAPSSIHEVGCGEGYWVMRWNEEGIATRGSDFSSKVIAIARENAAARGMPASRFNARSIYELDKDSDGADLVVCCEVLEHLEDPEAGLSALQKVVERHLVLSVPREPLWRILNLARGKYIGQAGNTPGHIQHWSRAGFVKLVSRYFEVVEVRNPLPWTMLLCRPRR